MSEQDETAHVELCRRIDLTVLADSFVLGWQQAFWLSWTLCAA